MSNTTSQRRTFVARAAAATMLAGVFAGSAALSGCGSTGQSRGGSAPLIADVDPMVDAIDAVPWAIDERLSEWRRAIEESPASIASVPADVRTLLTSVDHVLVQADDIAARSAPDMMTDVEALLRSRQLVEAKRSRGLRTEGNSARSDGSGGDWNGAMFRLARWALTRAEVSRIDGVPDAAATDVARALDMIPHVAASGRPADWRGACGIAFQCRDALDRLGDASSLGPAVEDLLKERTDVLTTRDVARIFQRRRAVLDQVPPRSRGIWIRRVAAMEGWSEQAAETVAEVTRMTGPLTWDRMQREAIQMLRRMEGAAANGTLTEVLPSFATVNPTGSAMTYVVSVDLPDLIDLVNRVRRLAPTDG